MGRRQRLDPQVLRPVRVLVLVHVEVAPAGLVRREHLGRLGEQLHRAQQQVVEVERVGGAQAVPVAGGELRDDPFAVRGRVLGQERLVQHLVLGPADRAQDGGRPELAGRGEVLLGQDPLHQLLLVVRVIDHEPAVQPDGLPVPPQHPGTKRVEGPGLDVLAGVTGQGRDPLAELARGPVGERHGQDPARLHGLDADQVRDAVRDHARLAGTRPGQDQDRAVGRRHGAALFRVEAADDLVGAGCAAGRDRGGHGLRVEGWAGDLGERRLRRGVAEPVGLLERGCAGLLDRLEVQQRPLRPRLGLRAARATALRRFVGGAGTHPVILGCPGLATATVPLTAGSRPTEVSTKHTSHPGPTILCRTSTFGGSGHVEISAA